MLYNQVSFADVKTRTYLSHFHQELLEFCCSDINILLSARLKFRNLIMRVMTGAVQGHPIDPYYCIILPPYVWIYLDPSSCVRHGLYYSMIISNPKIYNA